MKPAKSARSDAHVNLKRLYDERVPKDMSQEEFGKKYAIGTQGMVWQYLSGKRPLNIEAAAKFARGLRCTIFDISPAMAEALKEEVVPVLGPKGWWRRQIAKAAMVLAVCSPTLQPTADATPNTATVYYVKWLLRRFFWWKQRGIVIS